MKSPVLDRVMPWFRVAARVAGELAASLPDKDATPIRRAAAWVTTVDRVHEALVNGRDPVEEFATRYGLVQEHSEPFVSLFFDSKMRDGFRIKHFDLSKHERGIQATGANGMFLFVASAYGDGRPKASFWRSKEMDIRAIVDAVWAERSGRIGAEVQALEFGETKTSFYTFPEPAKRMFGASSEERLRATLERHRRFSVDGIPRAYCFYGPPGTGKTTFADRFAVELGGRVLRIDAGAFASLSSQHVGFLVGMLEPDALIVDDGDKAHGTATPRMLALLERFKVQNPRTTFMMTANEVDGFDRGFLRPDRVDEWIRFDLPREEERQTILAKYLEGSKLHPGDEAVRAIAREAEGLSHDYLREFAQLAERAPLDVVLGSIRAKSELLKGPKGDDEDSKEPKT